MHITFLLGSSSDLRHVTVSKDILGMLVQTVRYNSWEETTPQAVDDCVSTCSSLFVQCIIYRVLLHVDVNIFRPLRVGRRSKRDFFSHVDVNIFRPLRRSCTFHERFFSHVDVNIFRPLRVVHISREIFHASTSTTSTSSSG